MVEHNKDFKEKMLKNSYSRDYHQEEMMQREIESLGNSDNRNMIKDSIVRHGEDRWRASEKIAY